MQEEKRQILAHINAYREARPAHFRVAATVAALSLTAMVTAFAVVPQGPDLSLQQTTVVEQLALPNLTATPDDHAFAVQTRIQRGDTVGALFARLGVDDAQVLDQLRGDPAARVLFRQMRPGKTVTARTDHAGELLSLTFPLNGKDEALHIDRREGGLTIQTQPLALEPRVVARSGEIRSSLFAATDDVEVPDSVAAQMAEIFAGEIDFHRDLRRGDRFAVVYEMLDAQGHAERAGRLLAAEFTNQGKTRRAYLHQSAEGQFGYYDQEGKSLRKAFLRSPLEFSRISSGFAMRMHPILNELRAHRGIDYAAPSGTRVRAAGDGIVESVGRQGGYGNMIVLRHQGRITTHYGHLSGFAPGLRRGMRVSQGEVIGFVGTTGLSTGPHLHYEFRVNDVHRNPLAVALPETPPLDTAQRELFNRHIEPMALQLSVVAAGPVALHD